MNLQVSYWCTTLQFVAETESSFRQRAPNENRKDLSWEFLPFSFNESKYRSFADTSNQQGCTFQCLFLATLTQKLSYSDSLKTGNRSDQSETFTITQCKQCFNRIRQKMSTSTSSSFSCCYPLLDVRPPLFSLYSERSFAHTIMVTDVALEMQDIRSSKARLCKRQN